MPISNAEVALLPLAMRFRRLYWITEQLDEKGASVVIGVFTSPQDLVDRGMGWSDCTDKKSAYRLSLFTLDSNKGALKCWTTPELGSVSDDLDEFVRAGEISDQERQSLVESLQGCFS